jgi:hypothetical protein
MNGLKCWSCTTRFEDYKHVYNKFLLSLDSPSMLKLIKILKKWRLQGFKTV